MPTATDDTTPAPGAPTTLAEARARKRRNRSEVPICLDPDLAQAAQMARAKADEARARLDLAGGRGTEVHARLTRDAEDAEAAALEAEDAAAADTVTFVLEALGSDEFDALVDAHPPTKEQRTQFRRENPGKGELNWNTDTFPPALVHACLVAPSATAEEVVEMYRDPNWNRAELETLFGAALGVCQTRRVVSFSGGSRRTPS